MRQGGADAVIGQGVIEGARVGALAQERRR